MTVNGSTTNVSTYFRTAGMRRDARPIETTSITSPAKTCIPGPVETTIPVEGFYDPTIAQNLEAIKATQQTAFAYYPAGTATGNYCFSGTATLTKHNTQSPNTEANQTLGELVMSGSPQLTTI